MTLAQVADLYEATICEIDRIIRRPRLTFQIVVDWNSTTRGGPLGKNATRCWDLGSWYSFSEKTQLQPQEHAAQYVAGAVSDRNPTVVAVCE
jgi:hypothetical protein